MEHRITITVAEHGHDEENGERVLAGFLATHPETGPVVGQDLEVGTLDVTFSLTAADAQEAYDRAVPVIAEGFHGASLSEQRIVGLSVEAVPADELVEPQPV